MHLAYVYLNFYVKLICSGMGRIMWHTHSWKTSRPWRKKNSSFISARYNRDNSFSM